MNRPTTRKLKENQYHLLPNTDFWAHKNRQLAKPFTDLIDQCFLNTKIRKKIEILKKENPGLIIGETHCHSTYSDGLHSIQSIIYRASLLGLDYVAITDHLLPGKYNIESFIKSLEEQILYISEWGHSINPVKIYPAFEASTLEGHLILIFDPQYFSSKKISDISLLFSGFDNEFVSMLDWIPRVTSLGGISIAAHPNQNRTYPFGVSTKWIKENLLGLIDGIEDISSGHGFNENYSHDLGLASIGSSDDHFNLLTGTAVTAYDGNVFNDLITAVKSQQTRAIYIDDSLQPILKLARTLAIQR